MENKKYEVTILEKMGTCDNSLFEKMAKKGDITSQKVTDLIGAVLKITGYAKCKIVTADKEFKITYFDTNEYGLISSGSSIFEESVVDYFGEVKKVKIVEVKTKKGKTYKAVPLLGNAKTEQKETKQDDYPLDDLPF